MFFINLVKNAVWNSKKKKCKIDLTIINLSMIL